MLITLNMPGNPQYEDDPARVTLSIFAGANVTDYFAAKAGQWFYGVVHTLTGNVYLLAGNVHDDARNAAQQNARMMNTYASKPDIPKPGWQSLSGAEKYQGINANPTGHNRVAAIYSLNVPECLGFRVIKINTDIATFADRSNSMNGNKPDQRAVQVVPQGAPVPVLPAQIGPNDVLTISIPGATLVSSVRVPADGRISVPGIINPVQAANQVPAALALTISNGLASHPTVNVNVVPGATTVCASPAGYTVSPTARMPPQWRDAIVSFLTARLAIVNWAIDY